MRQNRCEISQVNLERPGHLHDPTKRQRFKEEQLLKKSFDSHITPGSTWQPRFNRSHEAQELRH